MIGFVYNGKANYISKLEDFRDFMEPSVYDALVKCIQGELVDNFKQKYEKLEEGYDELQEQYDELLGVEDECSNLENDLYDMTEKYNTLAKCIQVLVAQSYQDYIKQEDIIPTLEKLVSG